MKKFRALTLLTFGFAILIAPALAQEEQEMTKLRKLAGLTDRFASSQAYWEICSEEKQVSTDFANNYAYAVGLLAKELAKEMPDRPVEEINQIASERAVLAIGPYKDAFKESGCNSAKGSPIEKFYELNDSPDPQIKKILDSLE